MAITWRDVYAQSIPAAQMTISGLGNINNALGSLAEDINTGADRMITRYDEIDAKNKASTNNYIVNMMNRINDADDKAALEANGGHDLGRMRQLLGNNFDEAGFNSAYSRLDQNIYNKYYNKDMLKETTQAGQQAKLDIQAAMAARDSAQVNNILKDRGHLLSAGAASNAQQSITGMSDQQFADAQAAQQQQMNNQATAIGLRAAQVQSDSSDNADAIQLILSEMGIANAAVRRDMNVVNNQLKNFNFTSIADAQRGLIGTPEEQQRSKQFFSALATTLNVRPEDMAGALGRIASSVAIENNYAYGKGASGISPVAFGLYRGTNPNGYNGVAVNGSGDLRITGSPSGIYQPAYNKDSMTTGGNYFDRVGASPFNSDTPSQFQQDSRQSTGSSILQNVRSFFSDIGNSSNTSNIHNANINNMTNQSASTVAKKYNIGENQAVAFSSVAKGNPSTSDLDTVVSTINNNFGNPTGRDAIGLNQDKSKISAIEDLVSQIDAGKATEKDLAELAKSVETLTGGVTAKALSTLSPKAAKDLNQKFTQINDNVKDFQKVLYQALDNTTEKPMNFLVGKDSYHIPDFFKPLQSENKDTQKNYEDAEQSIKNISSAVLRSNVADPIAAKKTIEKNIEMFAGSSDFFDHRNSQVIQAISDSYSKGDIDAAEAQLRFVHKFYTEKNPSRENYKLLGHSKGEDLLAGVQAVGAVNRADINSYSQQKERLTLNNDFSTALKMAEVYRLSDPSYSSHELEQYNNLMLNTSSGFSNKNKYNNNISVANDTIRKQNVEAAAKRREEAISAIFASGRARGFSREEVEQMPPAEIQELITGRLTKNQTYYPNGYTYPYNVNWNNHN